MSPDPNLTEARITERMEDLRGLHRLGMSLLGARTSPLPREIFERRSLCVQGIVGSRILDLVEAGLPQTEKFGDEVTVFTSYAGRVHHVAREFDVAMPDFAPEQAVPTRCLLVGVTQQFSRSWDEIPRGWKAICRLRFLGGVPSPVATLPVIEDWDLVPRVWLATSGDLLRLGADASRSTP